MKRCLWSATAVLLTGTAAVADVSISGNGRFGLQYRENEAGSGPSETQISARLRFDLDVTKETDSGVVFGGRIRLQYESGDAIAVSGAGGARLSAAALSASYGALRLQVGNVDGAYDVVALNTTTEMGFRFQSFGNPQGAYYGFNSRPFSAAEVNRMGIAFFYQADGLNLRASWIDPNQTGLVRDDNAASPTFGDLIPDTESEQEFALSADYSWNRFTLAAAAVWNGAGIRDNDQYFIGAEYQPSDIAGFGILLFDNGDSNPATAGDNGQQVTLYGRYTFGDTTLRAYVANNDAAANTDDVALGVGAEYDLGGATLAGSVQQGYRGTMIADIGLRFTF